MRLFRRRRSRDTRPARPKSTHPNSYGVYENPTAYHSSDGRPRLRVCSWCQRSTSQTSTVCSYCGHSEHEGQPQRGQRPFTVSDYSFKGDRPRKRICSWCQDLTSSTSTRCSLCGWDEYVRRHVYEWTMDQ